VAFQPQGDLMASAGQDGFILWDIKRGLRLTTCSTDGSERLAVAFSPDGLALYMGGSKGQVTLWDVASRQPYHALAKLARNSAAITFSSDGIFLALGSEGERVQTASRHVIKVIALHDGSNYWNFRGHRSAVTALTFSTDSRLVVSGSSDGSVRIWQVGAEEALHSCTLVGQSITAVALHPDNQQVAIGTNKGVVQLWHAPENRIIAQTQQALTPVTALAFHPAGYLLAAGCSSGFNGKQWGTGVHLWDVITSRQRLNNLAAPIRQPVTAIGFSADGSYLAGAIEGGPIQLLSNQ
jgi:WD40 repeat protein